MRPWAITFYVGLGTISLVPVFLWERDCPETHLIGCSAGAILYKASWIFFLYSWVICFATSGFLTTSCWLINTSWITIAKVYNVERPNELRKNITDDVFRGTWGCISWNKILLLDGINSNHTTMCKLFVFNWNIWCHIILCKQTIIYEWKSIIFFG